MAIYFSSDHHFYHSNVIRYCSRPYSSVEEMNEALIANWNAVVKPEDEVIYLGDFSLAFRPVETITPRLNGRKLLIAGNHDWCHPYNRKSRGDKIHYWIEKYQEHGWIVLPEYSNADIPGLGKVSMTHFPLAEPISDTLDFYDNKHGKYKIEDTGGIHLCGHVHEKWKTKVGPNGGLQINVGVDCWNYTPVSVPQLVELIGSLNAPSI